MEMILKKIIFVLILSITPVFVNAAVNTQIQEVAGASLKTEIVINSSSHPEEEKWYPDNTPTLSFVLPKDTIEIKTSISTSKNKNPNISYIPPISEKTIDTLVDGKYYFAISAKTPSGWTNVSRRQINIDTIPPKSFDVSVVNEAWNKHFSPQIVFSTEDNISENIKYEIKVGDSDAVITTGHKRDNPYQLTSLKPGAHIVTVNAYDEAGNVRSETVGFIIESIATPKIVKFPNEVTFRTKEVIKGITYPNANVFFNYKIGEKVLVEENIKSNEKGDFYMPVTKKLKSGVYLLSVRVEDKTGAKSYETSPVIIYFKPFYTTMTFVLCVIAFLIVALLVYYRVFVWNKTDKINKKNKHKSKTTSKDTESITEKSFDILREGVAERIALLKNMKPKRKYIDGEVSFLEELESDLLEAKSIIVDDIYKISDSNSK